MYQVCILLTLCYLLAYTEGAVMASGSGLMRFKDGKPVALHPAPVPPTVTSDVTGQAGVDLQELARRYIDELLMHEFKLNMDRTNLEKFVTELLMWRKQAFPEPPVA